MQALSGRRAVPSNATLLTQNIGHVNVSAVLVSLALVSAILGVNPDFKVVPALRILPNSLLEDLVQTFGLEV